MNKALIYKILTPEQREKFERDYELDFCYEIKGVGRFRGNILYQRKGIDASFRVVPFNTPSLDELGLPPVVKKILDQHQGLILVTGAAGQGKSTTLAAMVDFINENRAHHVLTVEDPIEFVHPIKKGVVNQREIEMLGKMLGTADLLGQMADRTYLEKLPFLYREFKEGDVPGFESELGLLKKSVGFRDMTLERFKHELGGVNRYMRDHFRVRWGIDEDLYVTSMENKIKYLKYVVENHEDDYRKHLRRGSLMEKSDQIGK